MDKFDIGEIAEAFGDVIVSGDCEIVSERCDRRGFGYWCKFPDGRTLHTDEENLRKKNPPQESKDITETRQKSKDAPTKADIFKMFEDAGKVEEKQS